MRRRGVLSTLVAAGAALALAGCANVTHEEFEPVRYQLTAEVETPEGVRTGSSVIAVTWAMSRTSPPLGGSSYSVEGEAVAVDLPGGQTLFVLLRSATDVDWAAWVIKRIPTAGKAEQAKPSPSERAEQIASEERYLDLVRADRGVHAVWRPAPPHNLPGLSIPYFVRFRDLADPKSVEQVAPDDLASTFGPGYRLKSLTVQVTDDPVTTGIERRLGWLEVQKGMLDNSGDPNRLHDVAVKNLTKRDFLRGNLK